MPIYGNIETGKYTLVLVGSSEFNVIGNYATITECKREYDKRIEELSCYFDLIVISPNDKTMKLQTFGF